jgi:hypothetical protein
MYSSIIQDLAALPRCRVAKLSAVSPDFAKTTMKSADSKSSGRTSGTTAAGGLTGGFAIVGGPGAGGWGGAVVTGGGVGATGALDRHAEKSSAIPRTASRGINDVAPLGIRVGRALATAAVRLPPEKLFAATMAGL